MLLFVISIVVQFISSRINFRFNGNKLEVHQLPFSSSTRYAQSRQRSFRCFATLSVRMMSGFKMTMESQSHDRSAFPTGLLPACLNSSPYHASSTASIPSRTHFSKSGRYIPYTAGFGFSRIGRAVRSFIERIVYTFASGRSVKSKCFRSDAVW